MIICFELSLKINILIRFILIKYKKDKFILKTKSKIQKSKNYIQNSEKININRLFLEKIAPYMLLKVV